MRTHGLWTIPLVTAFVGGCQENPAIDPNNAPIAVAWLQGQDIPRAMCTDAPYDETCPLDEGRRRMGVVLPFAGSPVTVTLDSSQSSDRDGRVASYRWLSANFGADCKGRDPDRAHDPEDVAKPTVTLGEGFWEFGLWVEDDKGAVSDQSVVTIRIGDMVLDPCPDGAGSVPVGGTGDDAGTAADAAVSGASQCVLDCAAMMCPTEAAACDASPMCWPLLDCMGMNCGTIDYADMTMVTDCFLANCSAFSGGIAASTAAGPCVRQCNTDCMGM